jgi:hypothetical protein
MDEKTKKGRERVSERERERKRERKGERRKSASLVAGDLHPIMDGKKQRIKA